MTAPGSLHEKLYGDVGNLELTAAFFKIISVNVWQRTQKKKKRSKKFEDDEERVSMVEPKQRSIGMQIHL